MECLILSGRMNYSSVIIKKLFTAPDEYKKVTTNDIQRVAAKYFSKLNRTVGILNTEEE